MCMKRVQWMQPLAAPDMWDRHYQTWLQKDSTGTLTEGLDIDWRCHQHMPSSNLQPIAESTEISQHSINPVLFINSKLEVVIAEQYQEEDMMEVDDITEPTEIELMHLASWSKILHPENCSQDTRI